jgi:uncharacterized membrane protein YkvA (DUF1232 family)
MAERRGRTPPQPLLRASDFRAHLRRHAAEIAPDDVTTLVRRAAEVRRRLAAEGGEHPAFVRQATRALHVLADHAAGRVPHVPYWTVAVLAAALFYYLDPVDVIPDVVPHVGLDDDALVMELACREGADGIRRWQAWRETMAAGSAPGARRPRRRGR